MNGTEGPYKIAFGGNYYNIPDTIPNLSIGSYSMSVYNYASCKVYTLPNLVVSLKEDGNCDTLYVPTGFMPTSSSNGLTKILKPFGGGSAIQSVTFKVYNRYGSLVFISHDLNNGWDGTINGTLQDIGTYVWYLEYTTTNNHKTYDKGTSTLIR